MVKSSAPLSFPRRAHASSSPFGAGNQPPVLPITIEPTAGDVPAAIQSANIFNDNGIHHLNHRASETENNVYEKVDPASPPAAPPPNETQAGGSFAAVGADKKPKIATRFYQTFKDILLSSWLNVLLVFVPVGIAVQVAGANPTMVFAMNAIAIIPLAGLLSYATESVACELGDTIGALMNVTFGNAVELIIL